MDFDFLLTLVKYHRHFRALDVDDLSRLAFILGFSDSDIIAGLKVLVDLAYIDLQRLCQLRVASRCESDQTAFFNRDYDSLDTIEVAFIHLDLVPFCVLGRASMQQCFLDDGLNFFVVRAFIALGSGSVL